MIIYVRDYHLIEAIEWLRDSGAYVGDRLTRLEGQLHHYAMMYQQGSWVPHGSHFMFELPLAGEDDVSITPEIQMLFKLTFGGQ